ncbi:MAG: carboxylesterase family protein [bacterium]
MVAAAPGNAAAQQTTIQTKSGPVRGAGTDVVVFKGIPYAAPPIGARRWRPPAPVEPWTAVRDANQFGPQCPQQASFAPRGGLPMAPTPTSEDCLTLNVWTPAKSRSERLPVMVWIHGGGFTIGSGSSPRASGEMLAGQGVVVVTFNYRLGALGFFSHPDLSRESDQHVSGNYGLLDHVALLRWVRDNIEAFGGDPSNVTVFGQSAGASSVAGVLMVSPLARGLFHRVIAQSTGATGTVGPKPRLRDVYYGLPAAEAKNQSMAPDITKLRAMTGDEVIAALPNSPTFSTDWHFGAVIDGYVLPDDPGVLLGTSRQAKVPLLIGYNADEAMFYRREAFQTASEYRDFVRKLFPTEFTDAVLTRYPAADDARAAGAVLRMFTDFRFVTPTVLTARAASNVTDVYMYRFSRVSPLNQTTFGGAAHGTEIPYVFGHIAADESQYEAIDRTLSSAMAGAWVQFAKTGNPNGISLPQWPAFRAPEFRLLEYGNEITIRSNVDSSNIDFFQHIFEVMRGKQTSPRDSSK